MDKSCDFLILLYPERNMMGIYIEHYMKSNNVVFSYEKIFEIQIYMFLDSSNTDSARLKRIFWIWLVDELFPIYF